MKIPTAVSFQTTLSDVDYFLLDEISGGAVTNALNNALVLRGVTGWRVEDLLNSLDAQKSFYLRVIRRFRFRLRYGAVPLTSYWWSLKSAILDYTAKVQQITEAEEKVKRWTMLNTKTSEGFKERYGTPKGVKLPTSLFVVRNVHLDTRATPWKTTQR